MKNGKLWTRIGLTTLAVMFVYFAVTAVLLTRAYNIEFPYFSIINMTTDVVGMCVCIVLFMIMLNDRRMNVQSVYFMVLIVLESLILLWDFGAWYVNDNPDLVVFNKMFNYYVYGFLLLFMIMFWVYMELQIEEKGRAFRFISMFNYVMFFFGMTVILTNPWTGLVFNVDPVTGAYSRADTFMISFITPVCMILTIFIVTFLYIKNRRKKLALYSYTFLPFIGGLIQTEFFGIGLLYMSILFSVVLIYGNFYVERGYELAKKQSELMEQNVTMMISQIQPTFLYKSLRAIINIEGNPEETKRAIADFSKYMRGNLDTLANKEAIPFDKEMEHVHTYIDLEVLRFKEKLHVEYDIEDRDFDIPALTLQMLVENSIKHGITIKENGGTVTIRTRLTSGGHMISVIDDGVGFDTSAPPRDDSRSHVGLANTKQRLKELVGGTLLIKSRVGEGTTAVVMIPLTDTRKQ